MSDPEFETVQLIDLSPGDVIRIPAYGLCEVVTASATRVTFKHAEGTGVRFFSYVDRLKKTDDRRP